VEAEVEEEFTDATDDARARDAGGLDAFEVLLRQRNTELMHTRHAVGRRGE
jgi:hypothetical protein